MQLNDRHQLLQQLGINNDLVKARPLMTNYLDVIYYCHHDRPIGFKPSLLDRQAEDIMSREFKQIADKHGKDAAIDHVLEYEKKEVKIPPNYIFTIINPYTGKPIN